MALFDLLLGAGLAFAATSLGSLGILTFRKTLLQKTSYSVLIAFCAGVMAFSAVEMLDQSHAVSGDVTAIFGFIVGVAFFYVLEEILPHTHAWANGGEEISHAKKKTALVVGTITLHNVPEGFAIASAFANSVGLGWLVTTSITLQDIPEGLLVSTPLACYGLESRKCVKFGVLSGVVEFAFAVIGYVFLSSIIKAIPFSLAFSAGAMLYVVVEELLPDALQNGPRRTTAVSFISGILLAFGIASLF